MGPKGPLQELEESARWPIVHFLLALSLAYLLAQLNACIPPILLGKWCFLAAHVESVSNGQILVEQKWILCDQPINQPITPQKTEYRYSEDPLVTAGHTTFEKTVPAVPQPPSAQKTTVCRRPALPEVPAAPEPVAGLNPRRAAAPTTAL